MPAARTGWRRPCGFTTSWRRAKTRELLDNLINGMGKRDDALGIVISTQAPSDDHALAQLIDEGVERANPNTLVFLDAADRRTPIPWDPATWHACNPALGHVPQREGVRHCRGQGQGATRRSRPRFWNFRLNQRVSPDVDHACHARRHGKRARCEPYELEALRGASASAALDLSKTTDLSALVLVFPSDKSHGNVMTSCRFSGRRWTSSRTGTGAERERFDEWIRRGLMTAIPGPIVRYDYIAREIQELHTQVQDQGDRL